ncbi:MAG: hypothetical protein AAGI01_10165, partial [Myxococcota bacterium]
MTQSNPLRACRRRRSALLACVTSCLWSACVAEPERKVTSAAEEPAAKREEPELGPISFDGYIVPTSATKLLAPQNTFRVNGWTSHNSWIKLEELVDDGATVEGGDVVAKFKFDGERALPKVRAQLAQAQASRDQAFVSVERHVTDMRAAVARNGLNAQQAELDTKKQGIVSARELEELGIAHLQAQFEAEAAERRLHAYLSLISADRAFRDKDVERQQTNMSRFAIYRERFNVRAPHDGVVRHAFMRRHRRKVQKGDGMPSGRHFASVAQDGDVALKFFIPEH